MSARHRPFRTTRALLPILLIAAVLGAGLAARVAPAAARTGGQQGAQVTITIAEFLYLPATVTVQVGDTVTWINTDRAPHTVDSDNTGFNSGNMSQGQRFTYVATTPGTYTYYCVYHPFMRATLIVTDAAAPAARTFPETGKTVQGRFLTYWDAHGGLELNGFPLSDAFMETLEAGKPPYLVQYFERTRLEYHPENAAPNDVLLGQFGRTIHPADPAVAARPGARFFPETGHNVDGGFLAFWIEKGGLPQFGYPLTEVIDERLPDDKGQMRSYKVQYFERARFEYHPENAAPYDILLGQFGRQILGTR